MRRLTRCLWIAGALAGCAVWLWHRAEPPVYGRALFGRWRVPDIAVAGVLAYAALLANMSRRARLHLLVATGSCALTWLVLEAAVLTLGGAARATILGEAPLPNADIVGETTPDTARFFGLPCAPIPFHYVTNVHGYRNPRGRDTGTLWCVGDSCLVAAMLDWSDTPVCRLEQLVGRPCVNVALIAKSPQEIQTEFQRAAAGEELHGRVILQFLCEDNDLLDSARLAQPPPAPSLWQRCLLNKAVNLLFTLTQRVAVESDRRSGMFGDTPVRFLWQHERGSACEQQWPAIERSLDAFRASIEARGGAVGFVLIPQKLRVLGPFCRFPRNSDLWPIAEHLTPVPQQLAAWSRRSGAAVLDLTNALQARAAAGTLVWFADDSHWNAAGAATAAAAVAAWPWLRRQLARSSR